MIKFYCDKCGKEITDNVNTDTEETEVFDSHGNLLCKIRGKTLHICNKCQYNELTCGFKIGDEVITNDGRIGVIVDICTCQSCKNRGFYEPKIQYNNGDIDYMMISDKNNGFKSYYKIGDHIFGNLKDEHLLSRMAALRKEMQEIEEQLAVVEKLK